MGQFGLGTGSSCEPDEARGSRDARRTPCTKTLIHPKTIARANEIFAPAAADVDWARRVIAAHAEAVAQGRGVVLLDGRLIENLHVDEARRVVALAEAIEALARG